MKGPSAHQKDEARTTHQTDLPDFADNIFQQYSHKVKQTRLQKRLQIQQHASVCMQTHPLDGGADKLRLAQQTDPSFEQVRRRATQPDTDIVTINDLLYRRWKTEGDSCTVDQLVLPTEYRETVLRVAHQVPIVGHLGRKKTTDRLLQRFYWQGV